jgi:hypothetical protein
MKKELINKFHGKWDLLIMGIYSIISTLLIFILPEGNIVRIIMVIPIFIIIPGYIAVRLFGIKGDVLLEIGVSIGLSFALIIIAGLLIVYLNAPYSLSSYAFLLLTIILILDVLAIHKGSEIPDRDPNKVILRSIAVIKKEPMISILILIAILVFLFSITIIPPRQGWTEMALTSDDGGPEELPDSIPMDTSSHVGIHIRSNELEETEYQLKIFTDSDEISKYLNLPSGTLQFSTNTSYMLNLTLEPGEDFHHLITFIPTSREIQGLTFQLLTKGNEEYVLEYRFSVV